MGCHGTMEVDLRIQANQRGQLLALAKRKHAEQSHLARDYLERLRVWGAEIRGTALTPVRKWGMLALRNGRKAETPGHSRKGENRKIALLHA